MNQVCYYKFLRPVEYAWPADFYACVVIDYDGLIRALRSSSKERNGTQEVV